MVSFKAALAALAGASAVAASTCVPRAVNTTTCNSKTYVYNDLSGYGFVPSNARDKYGDTISLGSSIAIDSWKQKGESYEGVLYAMPDRGWNTEGTLNFQARIHKYNIKLTPVAASLSNPAKPNVEFEYLDTILLTGPDGEPTTGLDPDFTGGATYPGFPLLPAATYTGDGFGGSGPGGKRVCLDPEGLVLSPGGGFWISDEYGPYVYKFDNKGKMVYAIAPPDALLPLRNGTASFSANSGPRYDPEKVPRPGDPTQGRQNNQGFEGLTVSADGKTLYVLLQSAALQEGGSKAPNRRHTRLLAYSLPGNCGGTPEYDGEWVVPLPTYVNADGKARVAAQSELHYAGGTQFLVLPRDSGAGRALGDSLSRYRHVDVFDIAGATDISGGYDAFNDSIASDVGELKPEITPVTFCPWLDFNVNSQLGRFGLHNGGDDNEGLLNEKWEGLALVPVTSDENDGKNGGKEYYLFASSDNDFMTQGGFMNGGLLPYNDESGFNVNNQMLVFKVTMPKGAKPLVG